MNNEKVPANPVRSAQSALNVLDHGKIIHTSGPIFHFSLFILHSYLLPPVFASIEVLPSPLAMEVPR